jgi:hypothetical protein
MNYNCRDRRHLRGLNRRELMQIGFSALAGVGVAGLSQSSAGASNRDATPRAKSLLLIYLTGGASHHDSFDMKPEDSLGIAPDSEIRDQLGRPMQLNRGEPMHVLFTGGDV